MSSLQLTYDDIFDSFLGSVTDYKLATLEKSSAYELMSSWLQKEVHKSYVKRLYKTSSLDNVTQIFTFELKHPGTDETDEDQIEFVKGVVSKSMIIEWAEPQVKSTTLTTQMFAGKEQSFYAQANHLSQIRSLLEDTKAELRHELGDRGVVNNGYLGNVK